MEIKTREQWLAFRRERLGASEASAVVGMNPYRTNIELWEEKVGIREAADISDKPYVKYGNEAERPLRELFALDYPQYDVQYKDFDMRISKDYPFIFATLDGQLKDKETGDMGVYEGKTTEILKSMQYESWKDKVPNNYYIQVLHQLLATGYSFAILNAQLKTVYKTDEGIPDVRTSVRRYFVSRAEVEEDLSFLLEKEIEFWKCVEEKRRPNLMLPPI